MDLWNLLKINNDENKEIQKLSKKPKQKNKSIFFCFNKIKIKFKIF